MDEVTPSSQTKVDEPRNEANSHVLVLHRDDTVLVAIMPFRNVFRDVKHVGPPNRLLRLFGVTFAGRVQRAVARAQRTCERRIARARAARDIAESYQQE